MARLLAPGGSSPVDLAPGLVSLIPQVVERMQRELEEHFSQALPQYNKLRDEMSANKMLHLATSVFADTPTRLYGIPYHLTYRTSSSMPFTCYSLSLSPDLKGRWTYDKVTAAIIKDIIEGCRLDARTCTHAQLEETDPYVCCLTCFAEGTPSTMRWDQAVSFPSRSIAVFFLR